MKLQILCGFFLLSGFQPLVAQGDAQAALACFEEANRTGSKGCQEPPEVALAHIFSTEPSRSDASLVGAVLDGLEQLALLSDDQSVRSAAVLAISTRGLKTYPWPISNTVLRLARVYHQSTDWEVRYIVVQRMAHQVEEGEAIAFLEAVAQEDNPLDRGSDLPATRLALESLNRMGAPGRTVLERLHAQGTVPGIAKGYLEYLKQGDFKP